MFFSTIQLEHFRSHQVIATVLAENVPQLALQYYFIFHLNLATNVVVISFVNSVFNVLNVVMSLAIFYILHRNQVETPFTLNVSWRKQGDELIDALDEASRGKSDLDPLTQCGRRRKLAVLLGQINVGTPDPLKFEILSSSKHESGCTLSAVFVSEQTASTRARARSEGDIFARFLEQEEQIKEAVITAFELDPVYTEKFAFSVSITRTTSVSPAERAKLTVDGLRFFKVSKDVISAARQQMTVVLSEMMEAEDAAKPELEAGGTVKRCTFCFVIKMRECPF